MGGSGGLGVWGGSCPACHPRVASVNVAWRISGEEEDAASSVELLKQSKTANRRCKHVLWPNVQVSCP